MSNKASDKYDYIIANILNSQQNVNNRKSKNNVQSYDKINSLYS